MKQLIHKQIKLQLNTYERKYIEQPSLMTSSKFVTIVKLACSYEMIKYINLDICVKWWKSMKILGIFDTTKLQLIGLDQSRH